MPEAVNPTEEEATAKADAPLRSRFLASLLGASLTP